MTKHRTLRAVVVGMPAAGLSAALVLGHTTATTALLHLANTVIAIGGQGNPTSSRVRDKLDHSVVPLDYGYYAVQYPATVQLTKSRNVAVPLVNTYVTDTGKQEQSLVVAGYSLGSMVAEQEKRNLQRLPDADAPPPEQLGFVLIASPFAANGGIFGRFPGLSIPLITNGMGAAQPSRYSTTYSALMYDPYADFPAYLNPLALLNSALSVRYGHPDAYYDALDPADSPRYVTTKQNGAGGTDTYVLYANPHLPLFGPIRELAARTGTSAVVEPLISAVEPLARVVVDMAYTDRVNANPTAPVRFSLVTPPRKIAEALSAIPGALAQGARNLMSGGHASTALPNPIGNLKEGPTVAAPQQKKAQTSASTSGAPKPKPKKTKKTKPNKPESAHPTPAAAA